METTSCKIKTKKAVTTVVETRVKRSKKKGKISPWERALRLGPTIELVPGFSFDSDSEVKLYD